MEHCEERSWLSPRHHHQQQHHHMHTTTVKERGPLRSPRSHPFSNRDAPRSDPASRPSVDRGGLWFETWPKRPWHHYLDLMLMMLLFVVAITLDTFVRWLAIRCLSCYGYCWDRGGFGVAWVRSDRVTSMRRVGVMAR